jgi:predicted ester cyclase
VIKLSAALLKYDSAPNSNILISIRMKKEIKQLSRLNNLGKDSAMENDNKSIVKQYIEEVINKGMPENISSFISPHYTEVYNNRRYRLGIEGAKKNISGVRQRYPDLNLSVEFQVEEGEWVVTGFVMKGTHLGEKLGLAPTGKQIEVRGVNIDKVVNGKIIEHGGDTNLLDPFLELRSAHVMEKSEAA